MREERDGTSLGFLVKLVLLIGLILIGISVFVHVLHLLFLVDSDNGRQTVPLDEIVSEWQMIMLRGQRDGTAGEQYGRSFEKPLVTVVAPG